jgi:hypothetical protein
MKKIIIFLFVFIISCSNYNTIKYKNFEIKIKTGLYQVEFFLIRDNELLNKEVLLQIDVIKTSEIIKKLKEEADNISKLEDYLYKKDK